MVLSSARRSTTRCLWRCSKKMTNHIMQGIHHDGSAVYVSNPLPKLGETVELRLRVPQDAGVLRVFIRSTPDGEEHWEAMEKAESDQVSDFWVGSLKITMPVNPYCFKLISENGGYYYNALGLFPHDMPDVYKFKLLANWDAPEWVLGSVFYQIFPDRFCNGDPSLNPKDGEWSYKGKAVKLRQWGEPPLPWTESGSLDFYGGDLVGIQQKLDYLQELGVNAIYLNPIFKSLSNHRYNIDDFFQVDEHLGGNEALVALSDAMHARDMRIVLDLTPNHTSNTHPWFTAAQKDPNAETADFYTFYNRPDDYLAWLDVPTLPKLNYSSQKLRDWMYRNDDSVMRYWLKAPYNIDGWRLDVYNMTAKQGALQLSKSVGQEMRQAVKAEKPEAYLFGEHFFDGTPHLQGDELDATMNYRGFNIPLWHWLAGYDNGTEWRPETVDHRHLSSEALVGQLKQFAAVIPWVITRQQFNQLCSHDTTRILNIVKGDKALVKLGVAMLMTYPGVPCVYYGDEIGMPGGKDPDNRRTMPWDEAEWDHDLLTFYKRIIRLRRTAPALIEGGLQHLYAQGGLWVFLRESKAQRLVIVGYRGDDTLNDVMIPLRHGGIADGTELVDLLGNMSACVEQGGVRIHTIKHGDAFIFELH
ncbi:MAG: maltodextrin glucosidase [Chloroflexi bacterium]|nr:MAG: maltodextrin glucosidase [Chloroflexota bacterium]